jgi:hypothetical protein
MTAPRPRQSQRWASAVTLSSCLIRLAIGEAQSKDEALQALASLIGPFIT